MKFVLLPTDFSENSLNAISYALELYSEEECTFKLLYCYKVNDYQEESRLTPIPAPEKLKAAHIQAERRLKQLGDQLSQKEKGQFHFQHISENKNLVTAIREQITLIHPELIVIGTQGHTGDTEVVYGSNTVNIMEEIVRCPVLAVPANARFKGISEIVLANSYKIELNTNDLNYLLQLTARFKAAIRVLHIMEEGGLNRSQHENKQALKERLKSSNHSFHSLEFLNIPLGIYSFTESRGSEMIAFINKKHTFFENMLFSPVYKNLAHYSKVPVLVLHQP
ncbi:universal stress protein [Salinimicrobium soli]|uniref:universal stress protein n=1 Tax=Salinimicrobium soli TaxID=1254399 RepID=UPI003AAAF67B